MTAVFTVYYCKIMFAYTLPPPSAASPILKSSTVQQKTPDWTLSQVYLVRVLQVVLIQRSQ